VEVLDLSHNFINTITPGAFDDLTALKDLKLGYNSLRKLDCLGVPSLLSLDISHNRISTVEEVGKLVKCVRLEKLWFSDNPLAQRVSPRIRCLVFLRTLREFDGKMVTESDLAQVRMILDSVSGEIVQAPQVQLPPGKVARVNNVVLAPPLPALQPPPPKRGKMAPRHPR
jgi:hypothetical protein